MCPTFTGTSLIRNRRTLGPYSRTMPRALWGSSRGGRFLMSEVLLHSQMIPDELTTLSLLTELYLNGHLGTRDTWGH